MKWVHTFGQALIGIGLPGFLCVVLYMTFMSLSIYRALVKDADRAKQFMLLGWTTVVLLLAIRISVAYAMLSAATGLSNPMPMMTLNYAHTVTAILPACLLSLATLIIAIVRQPRHALRDPGAYPLVLLAVTFMLFIALVISFYRGVSEGYAKPLSPPSNAPPTAAGQTGAE